MCSSDLLDPASYDPAGGSHLVTKMGIDATIPDNVPRERFHRISYAYADEVKLEDFVGPVNGKAKPSQEIAIDALEMCEQLDHIVLFSSDGDFRRLVEAVQRRGTRVSVVSTVRSHPPMAADELRRQADAFIELDDLREKIARSSNAQGNDDHPPHPDEEDFNLESA